jgi:hypothetical protein
MTMAFDLLTKKRTEHDWSCGSFADDARRAITSAPDYFVRWYTIKSVGLGVLGAGLAFMLGREIGKKTS